MHDYSHVLVIARQPKHYYFRQIAGYRTGVSDDRVGNDERGLWANKK